jgi:hypothetical protein
MDAVNSERRCLQRRQWMKLSLCQTSDSTSGAYFAALPAAVLTLAVALAAAAFFGEFAIGDSFLDDVMGWCDASLRR